MRSRVVELTSEGAAYELRLEGPDREGMIRLSGQRLTEGDRPVPLPEFHARVSLRDGAVDLLSKTGLTRCFVAETAAGVWVSCRGRVAHLRRGRPTVRPPASGPMASEVRAPMTGVLVEMRCAPGTRVLQNQVLAVMEAMKMEYRLVAPRDARVEEVACKPGDRVGLGTVIVRLAPAAREADAANGAAEARPEEGAVA